MSKFIISTLTYSNWDSSFDICLEDKEDKLNTASSIIDFIMFSN